MDAPEHPRLRVSRRRHRRHGRGGLRTSTALAALAAAGLASVSPAEQMELDGGDTLTVTIVERTAEHLVVEHAALGRLEIPHTRVTRVVADTPTPTPGREPAASEAAVEAAAAIAEIEASAPPPAATPTPPRWRASVDLAANGAQGNNETLGLRVALVARRETTRERTRVEASYAFTTSNGDRSVNRGSAGLRREWLMPDLRWSSFVNGRYDYDEFNSWTHRLAAQAGLSCRVFERERYRQSVHAGAGVVRDYGSIGASLQPEAVLGTRVDWTLTDRQDLNLETTLLPNLQTTGQYRWVTRAGWSLRLETATNLSLSAGLESEYQSVVDPGRARNDVRLFAGLRTEL